MTQRFPFRLARRATLACLPFLLGLAGACNEEEAYEEQHYDDAVDQFNDSVEKEVEAAADHMGIDEREQQGTESKTMARLEEKLTELEREADQLGDKADARATDAKHSVNQRLEQVKAELGELEGRSGKALDNAKRSLDKSMAELEKDIERLGSD